jgi:two-component system phosphorelay protein LuxU
MLNTETLEQLKQDVGQDLLVTLVTIFIKETDQSLATFENSSIQEQQRISHSLKSSALSYGTDEVGIIAKQLELAIKEQQLDAAVALFHRLNSTWVAHKQLLLDYLR